MKQYSTVIGMDLGDKLNHFCTLDEAGDVIAQGTVPCTESALQRFFESQPCALVAMETGTHSPWISRLAQSLGHKVLVANARKLRAIYEDDAKCDEQDAQMLARIARLDPKLPYPITHRGETAQADLAVLHSRDIMVQARTKLITHVRGSVKSFGHRLPLCSTASFHVKASSALPEALRSALEPVLESIAHLTAQIKAYDVEIESRCKRDYPETELLRSIPGVGPITALGFVLSIEAPERFNRSRNVPAYFGLTPRRDQSGDTDKQLRITKAGDGFMRRLLVGCAQYILGRYGVDSALRRWGLKLAERGGKSGKRRAVVAVARKLAVLLHRLWINGVCYEAFPNGALEDTVLKEA